MALPGRNQNGISQIQSEVVYILFPYLRYIKILIQLGELKRNISLYLISIGLVHRSLDNQLRGALD